MEDSTRALLHDIEVVLATAVLPQNPGSAIIWNVTSDRLQAAQRVAREMKRRIEEDAAAKIEAETVKKEKKTKKEVKAEEAAAALLDMQCDGRRLE